jgi:hypothetical protein
MIQPAAAFKDSLALLLSIEGLASVALRNAAGEIIASIEYQPGKPASLSANQYLHREFEMLSADAAARVV